ncbi:Inositol transporter [Thalictrum thalictroides]|uniref:Inositol transporter n=1 Tax=Thalictrum thalictroides TaxID=46969 RepID=A0A7J6WNC0_THATH|nr:Inositol transporter [Thalictrum thalictroides]
MFPTPYLFTMMVVQGPLYIPTKQQFLDLYHLVKEDNNHPLSYYAYLMIHVAVGYGQLIGIITSVLTFLRDEYPDIHKKTILQEAIVSMSGAGTILGAVLAGWMKEKFGRKRPILASDILIFFGIFLLMVAPEPWLWLFVAGRLLVGLGLGIALMTVPFYISEIFPVRVRGAMLSLYGLAIMGAQFYAAVLSYLMYSFVPKDGMRLFVRTAILLQVISYKCKSWINSPTLLYIPPVHIVGHCPIDNWAKWKIGPTISRFSLWTLIII